ncbi:hypothetical protein [Dyella tabacisoli]|uniref:Uncharacterized protein n=1 Tax=Dyella tabacisoli TaxID=2282381 RepID=A0A369UHK8_9GAMM|nr:hypothetical protein [Dyella tabacisoli]RDD80242.1 hypothetical protein DVJ77_18215 [Dyella tabacisoli]
MRNNRRHLAWIGASMLVALSTLGFASNPVHAAESIQPEAVITTVGTLDANLRPPGVPGDFVITPNGYFSAACVQLVQADEKVHTDGRIERADGAIRKPATCTQPHYTSGGMRVEPNGAVTAPFGYKSTVPSYSGWVLYTSYSSNKAIGRIVANWTVPAAPTSAGSQVVYFFPGLEQLPNVQSILQPVLGWNGYNDKAWTMASWNCCVSGTTYHSSPIKVSKGDKLLGDTYSTCAPGVSCSVWAIVSTDTTNGRSTTLRTNPYNTLNWVFGGVLEAYGIGTCSQYAGSPINYTNIKVYDINNVQVASPPWQGTNVIGSGSPQCNYHIAATASTATLSY